MVTLVVGLTYITLLIPELTVGYELELCVYVRACMCAHACMYVCTYDVYTHTHNLTKYTG